MTASDPIIYSTTGEPPDDPECELEVNTLADGTVIVSNGELDRPVAEVAAGLWRQQAERFERELDRMGQMYDGVCAEREALKAAVERASSLARNPRTSQGRVENYVSAADVIAALEVRP